MRSILRHPLPRVAVLAATALVLAPVAPMAAAPAAAAIPAVDEVVSSANVRQVANVAAQPPFTTSGSLGSDIAFQGDYAFAGNFDGFMIYDISRPEQPAVVAQVLCPGSQNDISVSGDLLFLSTDSSRSDDSCASVPQSAAEPESWEGIKIFDISDIRNPRYVAAVETDCGSHTHTLVPAAGGDLPRAVYLYISSYNPSPDFPDCQPPHDKISIVKVPLADPAAAAVVAEPVLFPDGGNPGRPRTPELPGFAATLGCHDITVFPALDLAAGACLGDGILMDISDRESPRVISDVRDTVNFSFWHSATFNSTGTKVIYTDELGGGTAPTCNEANAATRGADGIYDIVGKGDQRRLVFRGYFKIDRHQGATENCVAHNGSLIPVHGRDIMVQAWYQGGISIWDFTDSANPREIGFWERGPLSDTQLVTAGSWSAYYYKGMIYSSDIRKGLDVLAISDPLLDRAARVPMRELNAQTQPRYPGG